MSDTGFIKLYRKMLDNPVVCKDADHVAVWIYLLLSATWQQYEVMFEGKIIMLEPGQLVTGRLAIGVHNKINEYKVQRILKRFENEHLIAQQTTPRNRLISVLNWNQYQSTAQQDEQQAHNNCTTSAQQSAHKQEVYKNIEEDKEYISAAQSNEEERLIDFPTNVKGKVYWVTKSQANEYQELYPAVDVLLEVREMKAWLLSNPTKRKTENGMTRFMNGWLSKRQNSGGTRQSGYSQPTLFVPEIGKPKKDEPMKPQEVEYVSDE